jgi:hypothetical protein
MMSDEEAATNDNATAATTSIAKKIVKPGNEIFEIGNMFYF